MMKLVPGMLLDDGSRVVAEGEARCTLLDGVTYTGDADLTDRATFLLALDELARRVGLDPAGGCIWDRSDAELDGPGWVLTVGGYWHAYFVAPGGDPAPPMNRFSGVRHHTVNEIFDTDDPLVALRAALEATE